MDQKRADRMYERADAILNGQRCDHGEPVLWHLALRRHADSMLALASRLAAGKAADPYSGAGLARRAFRQGSSRAGQHLAMDCFNRGDMAGYRRWLGRAARAGDEEAAAELRRYETRLPHGAAGDIGRRRPYRASDGLWTANRRASKPTKWYPPDRSRPRDEQ